MRSRWLHLSVESDRVRGTGRIEKTSGSKSARDTAAGRHLRSCDHGVANHAPDARRPHSYRLWAINASAGGRRRQTRPDRRTTAQGRRNSRRDSLDRAVVGGCVCRAFRETCCATTKGCLMKHKFFRGLGAILFKEFIVVWRDPMTLFFMFFPPLIEMVAFGYALDNDVKHMAMLVLNEDRSVESRLLIDRFVNTETFRVVGEVQSLDELESEMRKGRAYAALDIPPTFTRDFNAGHSAQVQLLVDGSNSTTALQALNTGLGVALTQSVESLLRETGRRGVPIDIRPQM